MVAIRSWPENGQFLNTTRKKVYMWSATDQDLIGMGSCHKRQKPQAPTPQKPLRNRQTRKVNQKREKANAKGLNRNTNLT